MQRKIEKKKKSGKSIDSLRPHCQVPLSIEIPKQECWSELPFPSPEDLPDPGIEPGSSAWQKHCLSTELPDYLNVKNL